MPTAEWGLFSWVTDSVRIKPQAEGGEKRESNYKLIPSLSPQALLHVKVVTRRYIFFPYECSRKENNQDFSTETEFCVICQFP